LLKKADRDLSADLKIYRTVAGDVPSPHSPVPDLTVDLTAPARAYENLGQRMFFGTGQTVDCAVDLVGSRPTSRTVGNERCCSRARSRTESAPLLRGAQMFKAGRGRGEAGSGGAGHARNDNNHHRAARLALDRMSMPPAGSRRSCTGQGRASP
jgi:hypothetical protein